MYETKRSNSRDGDGLVAFMPMAPRRLGEGGSDGLPLLKRTWDLSAGRSVWCEVMMPPAHVQSHHTYHTIKGGQWSLAIRKGYIERMPPPPFLSWRLLRSACHLNLLTTLHIITPHASLRKARAKAQFRTTPPAPALHTSLLPTQAWGWGMGGCEDVPGGVVCWAGGRVRWASGHIRGLHRAIQVGRAAGEVFWTDG